MTEKISWIVGPSHVVRWHDHVRNGVVRCPLPADHLLGRGGLPIWSKKFFGMADGIAASEGRIGVFVGDFRFGNTICLSPPPNDQVLVDGYINIESKAMTPEYDRRMLQRGLAGLRYWQSYFGHRTKYLFWCLFGREVQDRLSGKYILNASYHHPTFNYTEIVKAVPEIETINLEPLLHKQMHEISRLFIDASSHPSQIGYLFFNGVFFEDIPALDAYQRAVAEVEADLCALAKKIMLHKGGRLILTGRSVWLDTFVRYMGAQGAEKLAEAGLVLAPLDRRAGQKSIDEMCSDLNLAACPIVALSAGGADITPLLAKAFHTTSEVWKTVPCIDWESGTVDHIKARHETPCLVRLNNSFPLFPHVLHMPTSDSMVEVGPAGMPSWAGIRALLEYISTDAVPRSTLASSRGYRIEGDAVATEAGFAFLIGGNHSIRKYTSGELSPPPQSYANFTDNIACRTAQAKQAAIAYKHIIFPDKQSVLTEAYPFQPVKRLGDGYVQALEPALRQEIIYPADHLKKNGHAAYYPLDTHMTDFGSLEVMRLLLEGVGLDAPRALERIAACIVKPRRWQGDLGSKFTPPLYQEGFMLSPDWEFKHYISSGGFNEGMIDILLSREAPIQKTLLLFGDSFFRMMLRHFCAIFRRVVCLRTRFVHPEMIALIRPTVMFSGNAERYLSYVESDREANAFFLYPHRRGHADLAMEPSFLEAWDAVTAPVSKRSRDFFAREGLGEVA